MNKKLKNILLWIFDLGINLGVIAILVFVIQKWLIAPFDVSGASMCDTFNLVEEKCQTGYGEKIIINEATYLFNDPVRGDVVVFRPHEDEDRYFIKRVIGLPGETVQIKNGEVYISDKDGKETYRLNEDYLNENNKGKTTAYFSDFATFEVPEESYFLMGDNRRESTDGRSCFMQSINESCKNSPEKAFVKKEMIRGKAFIAWWPLQNIRFVEIPTYQTNSESLEEK
ncbi:MAG: signal peptidase I [Candidatus Peregrinibacteria bacterium]|nr:signal peptidase I [Candidatus Peregrinibacteria bacterium]